jgi:O-antigen/teichoic acid export membrane protein
MLNRSARAALSFFNNLLYQLSYASITLVITPLIVANLGTDIFGAWRIINKTSEFLILGTFKPLGLLQLTLAKDISNNNFSYKQQQICSAISILILTLPIMLILSGLFFYFRHIFIPVSVEISYQVNLTLLLMLFFTILSSFCNVPNAIVIGLNMHYKRVGISSVAVFITALLQYSIVTQGYTLPWFAVVSWLPIFSIAIINYIIILKNAPWFKIVIPSINAVKLFFKNNLWMFLIELTRYVFTMGDIILIGIYFGTNIVAIYSLTKTLITFLFMPVHSLVVSTLPGVGDLVGRKELKTLLQLRAEQIHTAVFLSFIISMIVMFFNSSFVQLWVSKAHFGGETLSRWLIIAGMIDLLVRVEAVYLDAFLKLKAQTSYLGLASVVYLLAIIFGEPIWGLSAFPIAQVFSQVILIILYWIGIRNCLQIKMIDVAKTVLRPLSMTIVLVVSILFSSFLWKDKFLLSIQNWQELFIQASEISILSAILGWFLILQKNDRKNIMVRVANVFEYFHRKY